MLNSASVGFTWNNRAHFVYSDSIIAVDLDTLERVDTYALTYEFSGNNAIVIGDTLYYCYYRYSIGTSKFGTMTLVKLDLNTKESTLTNIIMTEARNMQLFYIDDNTIGMQYFSSTIATSYYGWRCGIVDLNTGKYTSFFSTSNSPASGNATNFPPPYFDGETIHFVTTHPSPTYRTYNVNTKGATSTRGTINTTRCSYYDGKYYYTLYGKLDGTLVRSGQLLEVGDITEIEKLTENAYNTISYFFNGVDDFALTYTVGVSRFHINHTNTNQLTVVGADDIETQDVIYPLRDITIGDTGLVSAVSVNKTVYSFEIIARKIGYALAGFSTRKDALKAEFPVGSTTSVDWDGSEPITLYPVYTKQLIPPTPSNTFSVTFYNNKAEANRVDKTGYLTAYAPISGTLKEKTSIINPTITFAMSNVPEVNYAYIPVFNRYYFIENISSVRNGLWEISFKCDVLMSYKDKILEQTALVARNEHDYSMRLRDDKLICGSRPHIYTVPFTKGSSVDIGLIQDSSSVSQNTPFFVLTTFGKG